MKDVKLILGDCLEKMKDIQNKSIDMVLCDLPYGTTACKWDIIIPFDKLWEQYRRIVKDNGAIVLFGSEPFSSMLRISNLKMYKYDLIWDKKTGLGFLDSKFRPLKSHENISVFSIGGCSNGSKIPMKYNPQGVINDYEEYKEQSTQIFHSKPKVVGGKYKSMRNCPKSVLVFGKEKGLHPTQKPVALLEYLIKTYSNENDLILDNCAGSFSTAIAAINTNRSFIGIEKEENYFNIGVKRVKERLQSDVFAQDFELSINYK